MLRMRLQSIPATSTASPHARAVAQEETTTCARLRSAGRRCLEGPGGATRGKPPWSFVVELVASPGTPGLGVRCRCAHQWGHAQASCMLWLSKHLHAAHGIGPGDWHPGAA